MSKKGGVQKIQDEINTDEELEKYIDRPGLIVMDIYSEWCGPCLGMLGSLRKIKLESGGDQLSLAICKADTIEAFKRFRKKSEPTWLFVSDGQAVNVMFGTDTPKLMNLILKELKELDNRRRPYYNLNEYQPEEEARRRIKEDAIAEQERIQYENTVKKRLDYLMYVTDTIMENIPDSGVTIFGPQVNREAFKKIQGPAEQMKIQCKDRKTLELLKEQFETINFKCPNPIEEDVLDQLVGKELLLCFWRVPGEGHDIPKLLNAFAKEIMKQTVIPGDDVNPEVVVPPIVEPITVKVEVELKEGEEWVEEPDDSLADEEKVEEEDLGEEEEAVDVNLNMDLNIDLGIGHPEEVEEEEEEEAAPKKRTRIKKVKIPPIWVPNNHRTHAILIYMYFRNQTTSFLPPDPVPEPPHVIMAFDIYKKRDIIQTAERYKDDIPLYGFFTSDQADEAQYITNCIDNYKVKTANDKIVLKVNKATSHTMLSMVSYGPSYVSANTTVGHEEAKKFFPPEYKTCQQEREERLKWEAENPELAAQMKLEAKQKATPRPSQPTQPTTRDSGAAPGA